tara:strand:+ start:182 stop:1135 length:954 start_codon:yes stop_codon:yes gene_type:complete
MSKMKIENSPKVRFAEVDEHRAGQRIDNFLLRELKGVPKTRIYRALRKGEIRVNKGRAKASHRLQEGDLVRIPPLRANQQRQETLLSAGLQQHLEGSIVFEDSGLMVINKPSGLAVHGGSGLNYGLIEALRKIRPDNQFLELVHRLDRATSGCIMIAKKSSVLKDLHEKLRGVGIDKRYYALVAGHWPKHCKRVDAPLAKNILVSGERIVKIDINGKSSVTEFALVQRFEDCTLIEARPITGRTHQIRVHALQVGYPILGDEKYGDKSINQLYRKKGLKRLFLHAKSISLQYPEDKPLRVEAELDINLKQFLTKIGK